MEPTRSVGRPESAGSDRRNRGDNSPTANTDERLSSVSLGRNRFVNAVAWTALSRWLNRVFQILVLSVLARHLGPESFGVVAMALVLTDYLDTVVSQGLGFAIVQRAQVSAGHLSTAFWLNMSAAAAIYSLLWLTATFAGSMMPSGDFAAVLKWLGACVIVTGLSRVQAAILTRELRMKELALRSTVSSVIGGLVAMAAAVAGLGVWSLVAQRLSGAIIATVTLWRQSSWRPTWYFSASEARDLYSYSTKVFADHQLQFLSRRLDEALIGVTLSASALGMYSVAKRMVLLVADWVNASVSGTLLPALASVQNEPIVLRRRLATGLRLVAAVALPAYLGIASLAPELLEVLFGAEWTGAATATRYVAVGAVALLIPLFVHTLFHALGKPGVPLMLNGVRTVMTCILTPLGSLAGMPGVAAAFMTQSVAAASVDLVVTARRLPFAAIDFAKPLLAPLLCSIPMIVVARVTADWLATRDNLGQSVSIAMIAGLATYSAACAMVDPKLLAEVLGLLGNLTRVKRRLAERTR